MAGFVRAGLGVGLVVAAVWVSRATKPSIIWTSGPDQLTCTRFLPFGFKRVRYRLGSVLEVSEWIDPGNGERTLSFRKPSFEETVQRESEMVGFEDFVEEVRQVWDAARRGDFSRNVIRVNWVPLVVSYFLAASGLLLILVRSRREAQPRVDAEMTTADD